MPYIKYDGRELKNGMRVRLAGREGTAIYTGAVYCRVFWGHGEDATLALKQFPDLELWIDEPKISKEAAVELKTWIVENWILNPEERIKVDVNFLLKKIDSMTE